MVLMRWEEMEYNRWMDGVLPRVAPLCGVSRARSCAMQVDNDLILLRGCSNTRREALLEQFECARLADASYQTVCLLAQRAYRVALATDVVASLRAAVMTYGVAGCVQRGCFCRVFFSKPWHFEISRGRFRKLEVLLRTGMTQTIEVGWCTVTVLVLVDCRIVWTHTSSIFRH
ncbi:hypothetical protein BDW22DRAFT_1245697 [Trametopsis cervina]|nr:hypothetical protein BDW22DRAFT_1245697 [Trametopsis cervina]